MRDPKEACELIARTVFQMEFLEPEKSTPDLILAQKGALLKEAAEGTEEGVRTLLIDLEIRNRIFDQLLLTTAALSMAINALPEEGELRAKLIRIRRAGEGM